jgi:hypothetical protein
MIARLRAECEATTSAAGQAILLHELGVLEELIGDEAAAARDQLGAVNAEPEYREPLERLIAIIERRHFEQTGGGEGEDIAAPLKRSGEFPSMVTHMIAIGEKSGQLEQMLLRVAISYEQRVDVQLKALMSLLSPLLILAMGGAVGFIVFSILTPILQMNTLVK